MILADTVTTITVPEGVDGTEVCRIAYQRYRTSFGAGLNKLAGKVFRIGHLGDLNEISCLAALAAPLFASTERPALSFEANRGQAERRDQRNRCREDQPRVA